MSDDDKNNSENLEITRDILSKLTVEEAKILRDRLGFKPSSEINSDEVSAQFEVVRERIKQIEEKALKKLARKKELEALPKCSFCKLRSDQVKRLIAAPDSDVFICDECVRECLRVLEV
jgi:ClpX C4-type zinc finger/Sigma-70, region 4